MIEETTLINKDAKIVTPNSMARPIDYQGIITDAGNQITYMAYYRNLLINARPYFGINNTKTYFDRSQVTLKKIQHFVKFHQISDISNNHMQLHNSLVAITEKDLMYITNKSVNTFNTVKGTIKKVIEVRTPKCVDYDRRTSLLLTTNRHDAVIYNTRLNVESRNAKFYPDDEIIGRMKFNYHDGKPFVSVVGNHFDNFIWDPETEKISYRFRTSQFTNDIDYNDKRQLFAAALDASHIDLIDFRDKGKPLLRSLQGHLDFNFAAQFMGDNYLATGGQDLTTRIWDLRSNKPLFTIKTNKYGVYALRYSASQKILCVLEGYMHFGSYYFDGKEVIGVSDVLLGEMTGLALTPSEKFVYAGTFHVKPGVAKFEICC